MREAIHEILTDVSDSFSTMIDMALANEIRVRLPSIPASDLTLARVTPETRRTLNKCSTYLSERTLKH